MKIMIEEEGYVFSRKWDVDEYGKGRPSVDDAVDAALYLLACLYPPEEVEISAIKWEY